MKKLEKLLKYLKEIDDRSYIVNILHWELDTIAPKKSFDYLIDIKNRVEMEAFKLSKSKKLKRLLQDVLDSDEYPNLSIEEQRYLKELMDDIKKDERVPDEFMERYLKASDKSNNAWQEAKKADDYNIFKPHLEEMIELTKDYYRYMFPESKNLYDEMLDSFEKGMISSEIDPLFENLKKQIIPIVKNLQIKNLKKYNLEYSDSELFDISKYLLNYIGFDNERGALGIYPHGYTNKINRNDVRIAFAKERSIFSHIMTIIHEGGHGIFEQNIGSNLEKYATYGVNSFGLHESQSRFFENILGRNKNFWIPIYDDIKRMLKIDISLDEFMEYLNDAKPSLVRTEADELTYCLHIIMRYEIERDLFNNKIKAKDLEKIWNEKTKEYFGLDVPNAKDGILQDVHWSQGSFGYFPSYLLGSILDGMLYEAINEQVGDINTILKENRILEITNFLQENIHKYGGTYTYKEVIERVCHKTISIDPLVRYFEKKYLNK